MAEYDPVPCLFLTDRTLECVQFENCEFLNLVFRRCRFIGCRFKSTLFYLCDFMDCTFESVDLDGTSFRLCDFVGSSGLEAGEVVTRVRNCPENCWGVEFAQELAAYALDIGYPPPEDPRFKGWEEWASRGGFCVDSLKVEDNARH